MLDEKRYSFIFYTDIIFNSFFIATIIVARYLGPEHFGDFSAAYSVATIAYIVCLLGADIMAINVISMSFRARRGGVIKAFILYVFGVVALLEHFLYYCCGSRFLDSKRYIVFERNSSCICSSHICTFYGVGIFLL